MISCKSMVFIFIPRTYVPVSFNWRKPAPPTSHCQAQGQWLSLRSNRLNVLFCCWNWSTKTNTEKTPLTWFFKAAHIATHLSVLAEAWTVCTCKEKALQVYWLRDIKNCRVSSIIYDWGDVADLSGQVACDRLYDDQWLFNWWCIPWPTQP